MKISVVTVAYNAAATIEDTIRSVAAQDWPDYEHIIIDGASKDETLARVEALEHAKLRVISEPDRGLYDAMNKGLHLASGDLIGFLNADDFYCRTDALRLIAGAAARTKREAVSAGVVVVDPDRIARVVRHYAARGFRPWMARLGHMPPHPGFFVRREAAEVVGLFETEFRTASDFDWMVRFFLVHKMSVILLSDTVTAMRAGGQSQRLPGIRLALRESAASLNRHGFPLGSRCLWAKYVLKAPSFLAAPFAHFALTRFEAGLSRPPRSLGRKRRQTNCGI